MIFLGLLLLPSLAASWDVLFVNVFAGVSHQTISAYTANLLADHGHSVTYLSTNIPKYLRTQIKKVTLTENEKITNEVLKVVDDPDFSLGKALPKAMQLLSLCGPFFDDPYVQHLIETNAKFDAMVALGILIDSCAFALAHKLNIPGRIVQFPVPATFPSQILLYGLPIYHSSVNHDGVTYQDNEDVKASPLLRVKNVLQFIFIGIFEAIIQRFLIAPAIYPHVPDYPGLTATSKKVGLVLMYYHPLTDFPVPFGPGVVPLAGTLCTDYNPDALGDELREFVDSSDGFVYLSFGSHINTLLDIEKEILINAFAKMPFNVVWKMKFEVADLPTNVRIFSWLPQMSLLRHPKLRAFITHGGYASKVEAMCAGAPMLVIPRVAFDQWQNAELVTKRGLGDKVLSLRDSSGEEVYEKVMKITGPEITRQSKNLQRQILPTRTTEEQLLGYFDVAISGKKLLPGYQPIWEYFYLDIILVPIATIYLIKYLIRKIRE